MFFVDAYKMTIFFFFFGGGAKISSKAQSPKKFSFLFLFFGLAKRTQIKYAEKTKCLICKQQNGSNDILFILINDIKGKKIHDLERPNPMYFQWKIEVVRFKK